MVLILPVAGDLHHNMQSVQTGWNVVAFPVYLVPRKHHQGRGGGLL